MRMRHLGEGPDADSVCVDKVYGRASIAWWAVFAPAKMNWASRGNVQYTQKIYRYLGLSKTPSVSNSVNKENMSLEYIGEIQGYPTLCIKRWKGSLQYYNYYIKVPGTAISVEES